MGKGAIDWSKKYDENAGDAIKCPHCDKELDNHPRSVGAHIGYWHKDKVDRTRPTFTMACKECNKLVANSANVLGRHIRAEHGLEWHDYLVKHEHNGVWPKCKCGCGEDVATAKGNDGFRDFVKGHDSRGELNPMYGKKGDDSPNSGKVRTTEMRERYRRAANQRYKDYPYLFDVIRKYTKARADAGTFNGPKPKRVFNPFSSVEEVMDSFWEERYLQKCITENVKCVKSHSIEIPYHREDTGRVHQYWPDFLVGDNQIVEIKGEVDELDMLKFAAGEEWAKENGYLYTVYSYNKSTDSFQEMGYFNGVYGCIEPESYGSTKVLKWYGLKLDAYAILALETDAKSVLAEDVFGYYRKYGFPYPKLVEPTGIAVEFDQLKSAKSSIVGNDVLTVMKNGNALSYHFYPQMFDVQSPTQRSVVSMFNDDDTFMDVVLNRLGITYKETFNVTGAMMRQGFASTRKGFMPSRFNCVAAKSLYERFAPDNGIVYDYSAGFGQRLLGALSLTAKNLHYVGVDPWKENVDSANRMIAELGLKNSEVHCVGSEEFRPSNLVGKVDLAFSSPPYFNIEIYDNNAPSQAYHDGYEAYLEWWKKTVSNIHSLLADNGKLILNIVEEIGGRKILEDLKRIAIEVGFQLEDTFYLKMPKSHFSTKGDDPFKREPVLVFCKAT